jgi:hypothetical protein
MTLERSDEYLSCLRKRRHIDYLSALRHAAALDRNSTVVVYPCEYCGGLHVGHQARTIKRQPRRKRASTPEDPLQRKIANTNRKIEIKIKHWERGVINPRPITIKKFQQSLMNLREHLAFLESQLAEDALRQMTGSHEGCSQPAP